MNLEIGNTSKISLAEFSAYTLMSEMSIQRSISIFKGKTMTETSKETGTSCFPETFYRVFVFHIGGREQL